MERLDAGKIIYHADRLLDIKRTGDSYPVHILVGLTEYCSHKCIFCHTEFATADTTKNATMDREALIRFLKEVKGYGAKAVTLVGSGEPMLHPEIEKILYEIKDIGLDIGIFTNGSRMNKNIRKAVLDNCTFIRFSVNASNATEHETVHQVKGAFDEIHHNILSLVTEKKECNLVLPTIGAQLVFYEDNYRNMVEAAKLWKETGVDYFEIKPVIAGEGNAVNVRVFPANDAELVRELMEKAKKLETETYQVYTKYGQYRTSISENCRHYEKCYAQALQLNLWADGNLYLCGNHESTSDVIGSIYQSTFKDIWFGEKRKKALENISLLNCPKGCMGHGLNEIIWDYLYPEIEVHYNFV